MAIFLMALMRVGKGLHEIVGADILLQKYGENKASCGSVQEHIGKLRWIWKRALFYLWQ
jgi:hypothetical protein